MTKEEAIDFGEMFLEVNIDSPNSNTYKFVDMAIKELKKENTIDKIYADIQKLRGCSCSNSDGIIDDVEDILDKYNTGVKK